MIQNEKYQSSQYHGTFKYNKTQEPILPIKLEDNVTIQEHFFSPSYGFLVNSNNVIVERLALFMLLSK